MRTLTALSLATVATIGFFTTANGAETAHFGVPLDVVKTISVTDASNACGVMPVNLVYEDSHGVRHTVIYSVLGNGCAGD